MKKAMKRRLTGLGLAGMMVLTFVFGFISNPATARADESVSVTEQPDISEESPVVGSTAEPMPKERMDVVLIGVVGAVILAVVGGVLIVLGRGKNKINNKNVK